MLLGLIVQLAGAFSRIRLQLPPGTKAPLYVVLLFVGGLIIAGLGLAHYAQSKGYSRYIGFLALLALLGPLWLLAVGVLFSLLPDRSLPSPERGPNQ